LSGDLTKGRKKREETPANVGKGFAYGGSNPNISDTVTNKWHKGSGGPSGNECGLFVAQVYENHPSDSRVKEMGEVCTTVTSKWGTGGGNVPFVQQAVAIQDTSGRDKAQNGKGWNEEVSYTLDATGLQGVAVDTYNFSIQGNVASTMTADMGGPTHSGPKVMHNMAVRRLTPTECERLQGFPDGYTDIKPNGKQTPDGPRYKALGNSMAVPVMRWIGERINKLVALNNLM
jgi:site-specific DNA-cytosine methylase